jgi:hypothetical protein
MNLLTNFYKFAEDSRYCIKSTNGVNNSNKYLSFFVDDNMIAYKLITTAISLDQFKNALKDSVNKEESFNKLNNILKEELEGIEDFKITICTNKLKFLIDSLYKTLKTDIIEQKEEQKEKKAKKFYDKTFTITFGDQGENHAGMQKIGSLIDEGFTIDEILEIKDKFDKKGYKTEYYRLNDLLPKEVNDDNNVEEAGIVVVRNGLNMLLNDMEHGADLFFNEQDKLKKDSKALMRGRVVNKHARYNLCFSDFSQVADFEKGKGTVLNFKDVNLLNTVRKNISKYFGEKAYDLIAEGNYYYDPSVCGIGYHGDSERKIVIGVRVGKTMPLHFRWYNRFEIVSPTLKILLNHGDIYFSSEKAVGFDWKRSSKYTLRHAAGCDKFLDTESDIVTKEKKHKKI